MNTATPTAAIKTRTVRLGKFIHHDPAAAYLIAVAYDEADTDRRAAEIKIKGEILDPMQGERYELIGRTESSDRYGESFAFTSARMLLPNTMIGVQKFLARTLEFVGLTVAARITDAFGDDALRVLQHDPERVAREIAGITPERAQIISEWLTRHEAETALRVELESMLGAIPGIPRRTVEAAIEEWGADSPAVIRANPYRLIELPRIGFKLADEIAVQRFGYERSGVARRKAATVYALEQAAATDGHTVMPDRDLIRAVVNLIGCEPGEDAFRELSEAGEIAAHAGDMQLAKLARAEETIAERVRTLNAAPLDESERIGTAPESLGLADDQRQAWAVIDSARVTILTGAPGTGKTWLVAKVIEAAQRAGWVVQRLAAPTGKAAKRMSEAMAAAGVRTAEPAMTIYRMLGATIHEKTGEWQYTYTRENTVAARTLFVLDEWSMVSTELAARVFDAANDNSRILLVGDPHQLPSIGAGAVLRDMIAARTIPHAELTEIKRNRGALVLGIHAVKRGEVPTFAARLDLDSDPTAPANLRFIESAEADMAAAVVETLRKLDGRGFDPVWDVQVMSPLNEKGPMCCDALNTILADALNPGAAPVKGLSIRAGDKVVSTKNRRIQGRYSAADRDPNVEPGEVAVVNGDLGRVVEITDNAVTVEHWTPNRTAIYPRRELTLRPAYCLTVHKMQGSSAPVTVIPVHRSFAGPIWTREWLYTAISRAERACILIGEPDVLAQAVRRPQHGKRKTRLVELLQASAADVATTPTTSTPSEEVAPVMLGSEKGWFDTMTAPESEGGLPLHPDGRIERRADGGRVWLHPNEQMKMKEEGNRK